MEKGHYVYVHSTWIISIDECFESLSSIGLDIMHTSSGTVQHTLSSLFRVIATISLSFVNAKVSVFIRIHNKYLYIRGEDPVVFNSCGFDWTLLIISLQTNK